MVLEANTDYWDKTRFPKVKRIIFDNTLSQEEALELVKREEEHVDMVTNLSPVDTLRVAKSSFAKPVKNRGRLESVFGHFNMLKMGSPWRDLRLRQAVNLAINREDFIRYAAKGNGVITPALIPERGFGYDPDLAPYPYDPDEARHRLREAGYPEGLAITLIAPKTLEVQATVISKMLEQVGFQVTPQILDPDAYNRKTDLAHLDGPAEHQTWDIAIIDILDRVNFPVYVYYHFFVVDGFRDWVIEQAEFRRLYEQVLSTVNREQQEETIRKMERHIRDQAYFLFLYNPIQLYAVNNAVDFVPYVNTILKFPETSKK